ncbi:MAG: DUF805 domain-containing protein [Hyphomonadaceae bacterium]|nr:DUF805 domain-containing protein [Hyphomonadaceae bacterium]
MHVLNILFNFNGRINRAQYWLGTLGVSAVSFLMSMMVGISAVTSQMATDPAAALTTSLGTLGFSGLINIFVVWASLAIQVKRFHDRGRSGWFAAVPFVLVFWIIGSILSSAFSGHSGPEALANLGLPVLLFVLVSVAFFIDLGCLPGKPGPNKFGDPPGSVAPSTQFNPKGGAPTPSTSLDGAASALERAIAQRESPSPAAASVAPRPAVAARPAFAPNLARPAAPTSFGRRTTR